MDNAKMALQLMSQHHVDPTPQNYAIWYEYVGGQNKGLIVEIDMLIEECRPFTPETNEHLFNQYIVTELDQEIIEKAQRTTESLLAQVANILDEASSGQRNYNKDLDSFAQDLQGDLGTETGISGRLKNMVGGIVQKTLDLKAKGDTLDARLKESMTQVETLKSNLDKVTLESQTDFLTGVSNRQAFDTTLSALIQDAEENKGDVCLILIDIDHFKKFNDKYGHQMGDQVLKLVANALTNSVKGQDVVARYGGEEFAVILPDTPLSGALVVADKLRKTVESKTLRRKDTHEVIDKVTISSGVARYHYGNDELEALISRADEALYKSKQGGRNKVTQESTPPKD